MKRQKVIFIISILTIMILLGLNSYSLATSIDLTKMKSLEISDDYKKYLALSDNEKKDRVVPELYNIPQYEYKSKNLLRNIELVGASVSDRKFSLMSNDQLGDIIKIKNQKSTTECWAFSALSSLETNLALNNKRNNVPQLFYDFSERHMDYSNIRVFNNNQINIYGSNRTPSQGGNYEMALSYLTNGMGAINEEEMPFKDDTTSRIDISEIQNKEVITQVHDTMSFPTYTFSDDKTRIINLMKDYIKDCGSIATKVYCDVADTEYYNNSTGAAYYDGAHGKAVNHGVSIIGWDDDYNKDNFNEKHRPNNNGAWIIRNSWGEELEYTFYQMKEQIFAVSSEINSAQGWTSPSDIPDNVVIEFSNQLGYTVDSENKKVNYKVGDNGLMYYSYEDANIYKNMFAIVNATTEIDYDNLYQYNENGSYAHMYFEGDTIYQANKFTKISTEDEYLTQVGFYTAYPCNAKVYVNLNGSSINKEDLTPVVLEVEGYQSLIPGFQTIKFAHPLKINSNEFSIVVETQFTGVSKKSYISLEGKIPNSMYSDVKLESGKCFFTTDESFENNEWLDLSTLNSLNSNLYSGDSSIKAYTIHEKPAIVELSAIRITTPPTKTEYNEGEDFDTSGMVVTAYYTDNTSRVIDDYRIVDGSNLKAGHPAVSIEYQTFYATQKITVNGTTTPTITPTVSPEPSITPSVTPTVSPEPTTTPSVTPDLSPTPSVEPTITPDPTGIPDPSITPTPTGSPEPTSTPSISPTGTPAPIEPPVPTSTPTPDEPSKEAKNSSLKDLKANITGVKRYTFTDDSNKNYTLIDIEVDIDKVKGNDSLSYYYYLTTTPNAQEIKLFTKIVDKSTNNNKIIFTLNTKDITNFDKISNNNTIYLYIEEVAKNGGNQSVAISDPIKLDATENVEEYVNNIKQNNPNGSNIDDTVADKVIPQTGINPVIIISITVIAIIGVVVFIRYKYINNDMK